MKKELLLSFVLHIGAFSIFPLIKSREKEPLYPASVYQVSIRSIPTPSGNTQFTGASEKPKQEVGKKEKKKIQSSTKKEKAEPRPQESGLPQGSSTSGSPISTEGGEFKYSWYLDIILSKIAENWHNPYEGEGEKISAVAYFRVQRDGIIDNVKLEKSSRNYYFDQAALRAVQSTKNLPPLPQEFEKPYLGVYFEFEYVQ